MLKLNQIQAIHNGMKSDVETMQGILDRLNAEIVHIKSDGTRHDTYIKDKVAEARKVPLSELGAILGNFGPRLNNVKSQTRYWNSVPFLLSQQVFNTDPALDATIRLAIGSEFAAMDSALMQLAADSAIYDKNLPLIWQAWLAGLNRKGQPGWRGINPADIAIPEQTEALTLIRGCEGLAMQAHNIVAQASGGGLTPVRKLQSARALA